MRAGAGGGRFKQQQMELNRHAKDDKAVTDRWPPEGPTHQPIPAPCPPDHKHRTTPPSPWLASVRRLLPGHRQSGLPWTVARWVLISV